MSFKSVVNNKKKEIRWVTYSGMNWTNGYTTGYGIPSGYCKFSASHYVGNYKFLRNSMYGKLVKIEDFDRISYEMGVIFPYTRNCVKFVMSRAARKRGYTTNDFLYNSRAKSFK